MIEWLRGEILEIDPTRVILNVNGVGYGIEIPVSTFEKISRSAQAELYITTYLRENEIRLFGFSEKKEKEFFHHIMGISGIGPRTAISMLSSYSVDELTRIISEQDIAALTKIPGIGKKTAERILFELREKFDQKEKFAHTSRIISHQLEGSSQSVIEETILALVALGYRQAEAEKAVSETFPRLEKESVTVEILLKACLKEMK